MIILTITNEKKLITEIFKNFWRNNRILPILLCFFPLITYGQNEYYSIDSSMSVGVKLIDGGAILNSRICQVKKDGEVVEYSPYEVKEYGLKDGRVYVSKVIQLSDSSKRRVFLERLYKGKVNLYYYRAKGIKTYYIETDSGTLIELPKRNANDKKYNEELSAITNDCPNVADASKLAEYNKQSLTNLFKRYNKCELKPFPHFKYGLIVGYEFARLVPSGNSDNVIIQNFDFNYDGSFTIGFFLDNPILSGNFSIHPEIYISKHGYSYSKSNDNKDVDFVANLTTFKMPLLIRYEYPSDNIRLFVNLGPIVSYNIKRETMLLETTITENLIEINSMDKTPKIDGIQLGYEIGGGIEYKLTLRYSLFVEIRYNKQYGIGDSGSMGISGFNLLTGLNF